MESEFCAILTQFLYLCVGEISNTMMEYMEHSEHDVWTWYTF
jgi:hypothetical protein